MNLDSFVFHWVFEGGGGVMFVYPDGGLSASKLHSLCVMLHSCCFLNVEGWVTSKSSKQKLMNEMKDK